MRKLRFTKPENRLAIAHNALAAAQAPKKDYFIERASIVEGQSAEVYYIDSSILESGIIAEDDWSFEKINLADLEAFVKDHFKRDGSAIDLTLSDFIQDNLHMVVKAFLDAGKETVNV